MVEVRLFCQKYVIALSKNIFNLNIQWKRFLCCWEVSLKMKFFIFVQIQNVKAGNIKDSMMYDNYLLKLMQHKRKYKRRKIKKSG